MFLTFSHLHLQLPRFLPSPSYTNQQAFIKTTSPPPLSLPSSAQPSRLKAHPIVPLSSQLTPTQVFGTILVPTQSTTTSSSSFVFLEGKYHHDCPQKKIVSSECSRREGQQREEGHCEPTETDVSMGEGECVRLSSPECEEYWSWEEGDEAMDVDNDRVVEVRIPDTPPSPRLGPAPTKSSLYSSFNCAASSSSSYYSNHSVPFLPEDNEDDDFLSSPPTFDDTPPPSQPPSPTQSPSPPPPRKSPSLRRNSDTLRLAAIGALKLHRTPGEGYWTEQEVKSVIEGFC